MDMDISMDIHAKSVDMDMDMDGKFHIHGNSAYSRQRQNCSPQCPLNIGLLSSDVQIAIDVVGRSSARGLKLQMWAK